MVCMMAAPEPPPPHDHGTDVGTELDAGEERVNPKHALLGDPIIGNEGVLLGENGPGARLAESMPTENA